MRLINPRISLSIAGVVVAGALYIGGKYSHSVKDVFAIQESPTSQESSTTLEETVNPIDPYVKPDYAVLNPDAPPLVFDTFSAPSDSYASRIREALSFQSTEERVKNLRRVISDYICTGSPTRITIINDTFSEVYPKTVLKDRLNTLTIGYGSKDSNSPVRALECLYGLMVADADDDASLRSAFVVYAREALDFRDAVDRTLVTKKFPCKPKNKLKGERK